MLRRQLPRQVVRRCRRVYLRRHFVSALQRKRISLKKNAALKRRHKNLPLVVANLAQNAIGSNESELMLLDDNGKHVLPKAPKIEQARHLIKHISVLYESKKKHEKN